MTPKPIVVQPTTPEPEPDPAVACAPELLAALEDLNRNGFASPFAPGSVRLMELLNRARGARP
jgi:hypothetical protein